MAALQAGAQIRFGPVRSLGVSGKSVKSLLRRARQQGENRGVAAVTAVV